MKIQKFEEIIAWQKAQELAVRIYRKFSELEDKTFKSQICRAAISISNNIAEGFDRKSDKEFSYFLYIGLGSNSEVKSMVYLANKLGYIQQDDQEELLGFSSEVAKVIRGLIKSIKINPWYNLKILTNEL